MNSIPHFWLCSADQSFFHEAAAGFTRQSASYELENSINSAVAQESGCRIHLRFAAVPVLPYNKGAWSVDDAAPLHRCASDEATPGEQVGSPSQWASSSLTPSAPVCATRWEEEQWRSASHTQHTHPCFPHLADRKLCADRISMPGAREPQAPGILSAQTPAASASKYRNHCGSALFGSPNRLDR